MSLTIGGTVDDDVKPEPGRDKSATANTMKSVKFRLVTGIKSIWKQDPAKKVLSSNILFILDIRLIFNAEFSGNTVPKSSLVRWPTWISTKLTQPPASSSPSTRESKVTFTI